MVICDNLKTFILKHVSKLHLYYKYPTLYSKWKGVACVATASLYLVVNATYSFALDIFFSKSIRVHRWP